MGHKHQLHAYIDKTHRLAVTASDGCLPISNCPNFDPLAKYLWRLWLPATAEVMEENDKSG